jgi:ribosomal protein S18 acetylase RimI-like enzyme
MKAYRGMEEYGESTTDQAVLYLQRIHRFCSHGFFKAVINGRTAGFIVCDPEWYEPGQRKVLEIHEVVVDPDYQGYGLGSLFMRFAGAMGRRHGRSVVSLWAGEGNRKAIGWYTSKFGFRAGRRDGVWIHYQVSVQAIIGQQ